MNLKETLKMFKLNESKISLILGALVVLIIGVLGFNYFRNQPVPQTSSTGTVIEDEASSSAQTHTVAQGESLWTIAQKYYNDGFQWTKIKEANSLESASSIEVGQELLIPDMSEGIAQAQATAAPVLETIQTPAPTIVAATVGPTVTPSLTSTPKALGNGKVTTINPVQPAVNTSTDNAITGDKYTVEKGDNLWNIAVRAYGDGYQWTKIAKANNLVNPSLIHRGNVFIIPR